jgi:hypothetical protein
VSDDPLADPTGPPEPHRWHSDRDVDRDVLAVVASAVLDDHAAAALVLGSLGRAQLLELVWAVSCWCAFTIEREGDPFVVLRDIREGIDGNDDHAA